MYTIAAAYGYIHSHEDVADWGADAIADSADALPTLLHNAFQD